jgi:undecaprenyl-diphosphatase
MMNAVFLYAMGTTLIETVIKEVIARPRPFDVWLDLEEMYQASGLSFPSGHTYIGFVMTLPLIFALLTANKNFKSNGKKVILSILLIIYSTLMGLSRIIVGVHYPSDVLFSVGLAFFATYVMYLVFSLFLKKSILNAKTEKYFVIIGLIWLVIAVILFT